MDSLTILKSLVAHLEPRRAVWPKVGQMNGYGKMYSPRYDLNEMVNAGRIQYHYILGTVLYYLFQDVNVPIVSYSVLGGYVPGVEIIQHTNSFAFSTFSGVIQNLYERTRVPSNEDNTPDKVNEKLHSVIYAFEIPVSSAKGYMEYLITLEEKYSVNPENIARYNADIEKSDALLKVKEEHEKKEAEENERAWLEYEKKEAERKERIRLQREKKEKEKKEEEERKKMEEEAKAFEEEVQRRVKLELYERRVRAEVERRLKALDDAKAEAVPVEEAVVQTTEVKEDVKEEAKEEAKEEVKKPLSILERFKGMF